MRSAPSKDDATKDSDSDPDKPLKHGKIERIRKDSDNRGRNDPKGYVLRSHRIIWRFFFLLN